MYGAIRTTRFHWRSDPEHMDFGPLHVIREDQVKAGAKVSTCTGSAMWKSLGLCHWVPPNKWTTNGNGSGHYFALGIWRRRYSEESAGPARDTFATPTKTADGVLTTRPSSVITTIGHGSEQLAADAMKAGAYDYPSQPITRGKLMRVRDEVIDEEKHKTGRAGANGPDLAVAVAQLASSLRWRNLSAYE